MALLDLQFTCFNVNCITQSVFLSETGLKDRES